MDILRGGRGCDGVPGDAAAAQRCTDLHDDGGWGSAAVEAEMIPNRNVWFLNNLIVNPSGVQSQWQHLQVHPCVAVDTAATNVANPSCATDGLRIAGNVVVNGPLAHPMGVGGECAPVDSPCNEARLRSTNSFNTVAVVLEDPAGGDWCVASLTPGPALATVPDWSWSGAPSNPTLPAPADLTIHDEMDRLGRARTAGSPPGAC